MFVRLKVKNKRRKRRKQQNFQIFSFSSNEFSSSSQTWHSSSPIFFTIFAPFRDTLFFDESWVATYSFTLAFSSLHCIFKELFENATQWQKCTSKRLCGQQTFSHPLNKMGVGPDCWFPSATSCGSPPVLQKKPILAHKNLHFDSTMWSTHKKLIV